MKILYISPENTVGTLNLWKRSHEKLGNECIFITFYPSKHNYDPGICLSLPLINSSNLYIHLREKYYQLFRGGSGVYKEKEGYPPIWEEGSLFEKLFFQFRDWLWSFKVEKMIKKLSLLDYDIIHLEWGLEFYRNGSFIKRLHNLGKPIVCTYHGQDMKVRGVIPIIDKLSSLNLTSELDLLDRHPNIQYQFLPYDTSLHCPKYSLNSPIKICHSPTNRYYKGSNTIIPICEKIALEENIEFILIENIAHKDAIKIKSECDIFIDQIHNRGGWGYGMNSIEALSMGLCCLTELNNKYIKFIPDHPFVNVDERSLYEKLKQLINYPEKIIEYKKRGKYWVEKKHDLNNVAEKLYQYYNEKNWT